MEFKPPVLRNYAETMRTIHVDEATQAADRGEFVEHLRVRELIDNWYPA